MELPKRRPAICIPQLRANASLTATHENKSPPSQARCHALRRRQLDEMSQKATTSQHSVLQMALAATTRTGDVTKRRYRLDVNSFSLTQSPQSTINPATSPSLAPCAAVRNPRCSTPLDQRLRARGPTTGKYAPAQRFYSKPNGTTPTARKRLTRHFLPHEPIPRNQAARQNSVTEGTPPESD